MQTTCCICGVVLLGAAVDQDTVFCPSCFHLNFAGQALPDVDVPHITIVGLTTRQRQAYERLARRHREETHDAR
jgi:hypothetical protein